MPKQRTTDKDVAKTLVDCKKKICPSCGDQVIHRADLTVSYLQALLLMHKQMYKLTKKGLKDLKDGNYGTTLEELKKELNSEKPKQNSR